MATMATEPLTLNPAILEEIEHYVANLADDVIDAYLTELEMITEGNIDDKTIRFLKRLCGDYSTADFATTDLPNSYYTRARREHKLFDLTSRLPLTVTAKCEIFKLQNLSHEFPGNPLAESLMENMSLTTCQNNFSSSSVDVNSSRVNN